MRGQNILQGLLFAVFFAIGVAALSGSILSDELIRYYEKKHLIRKAEQSTERLRSLNSDYQALIDHLNKDPNVIKNIAPATLGTDPNPDPNTVYPKAKGQDPSFIRKIIKKPGKKKEIIVPAWLQRCSKPAGRIALAAAGVGLILISLVFFGPKTQNDTE